MIYPNPSNGIVFIKSGELSADNCTISVYDMSAGLVHKMTASLNNIVNLDLTHLKRGAYFLKIRSGDKTITKRIVIK